MCQLLALSFNRPVNCRVSFRGFHYRGDDNPDGWGLGWYLQQGASVVKEPVTATESPEAKVLTIDRGIYSPIFIGHVRRASQGRLCPENTHPFQQSLGGKDYLFAHNGTLRHFDLLETGHFQPEGSTDSEHTFCFILHQIESRGLTNRQWNTEDFDWLSKMLSEINGMGNFNCLMSDGEHLFCYRDRNGHNGLYFTHRRPPYEPVPLSDEDWEVNLTQEKSPAQVGYVIATQPLTNECWEPFHEGELVVLKAGEIIHA